MCSTNSRSPNLLFGVQDRVFTVQELLETLMLASGGKVSEGYFKLLDTEISEALYFVDLYINVQKRINPPTKNNDIEGFEGVEFDSEPLVY
jgi:hypothetical protein